MDFYGIKDFPEVSLTGKIKQKPDDFVVEEITPSGKICKTGLDLSFIKDLFPQKPREHLHFTLVKYNYTTERAVAAISKKLRISKNRFGYAGTKDKVAFTAQRVSVWNQKIRQLKWIRLRDIRLKDYKYEPERLTLGDLSGNRFLITIRNINAYKYAIDDELKKFREKIQAGILNYFGPQRFGEQRTVNHLIGKQLLLGNFEGAMMILLTHPGDISGDAAAARKFASDNWGKWSEILKIWPRYLGLEASIMNHLVHCPNDFAGAFRTLPKKLRRMFIHAVQSYIFNVTLTKISGAGIAVPEKMPLVGYETKLDGKVGEIILSLLGSEDLKQEYFKLGRMPELAEPGSERETLMKMRNFRALKVSDGEAVISFELDKGSYATVLLMNFLRC
ncbi:MAG: tRNA pseudouridine(13) synthase TruD [Candidatus Nanoarchaeia archaeon]|nr:tRNA pseudouridine(13) synthase TruD [Candidatus Nanoarchaeia archaeon]MDD5239382.1 tRNA pseudouridine(13) synthase TruD [Candidatus Nanoarchaeia archaeon]